jgi:predicted amidohydrolase YtcJ
MPLLSAPIRLATALAITSGALLLRAREDQPPARAVADVVLLGGRVYTAYTTPSGVAWAQAVAVRGDRVLAVGTDAQVRALAGPATRVIALGGRTVVPGINDAHDHVDPAFGVPVRTVDGPEPDPPLALVLDSVRAVAARTPTGGWLSATVGMRVVDDTLGRLAALDRAAPDHPVLLRVPWGHFLQANHAALRAMGIDESSRDPAGGWYGRDADGRLNGLLHENAALMHMRRLKHARLPARAYADAYRALSDEALRYGITTVQDMSDGKGAADAVAGLRSADVPLRVRLVEWPVDDGRGGRAVAEWNAAPRRVGARAVVSGRKYMLDGTPLERLAMQRRDYADRPGWRGRLNYPPDTVRAILAEALRSREQLMLHAVGDSTVRLVLGLMQALAPDSAWKARRPRIEHGDWLSPDLLPAAERLGVVLVQNPAHLMLGPPLLRARYGRATPDFQPLRDVGRSSVRLALGSDGPRNPWLNVLFATTHANSPAQALTREQAVHAYTFGAAYAERAEGEKGTLRTGQLADLAVLSQDPFTVPPPALPATTSVLTMIGGRIAYDAGVLRATRAPAR